MSDDVITFDWAEVSSEPQAVGLWGKLYTFVPIVLVIGLAGMACWINDGLKDTTGIVVKNAVIISFVLAVIPILICVVQTTTRQRQLEKLRDLEKFYIAKTYYFRSAMKTVESMRPVSADLGYIAPLLMFMIVMAGGFLLILIGYSATDFFLHPHVVLAGMQSLGDSAAANGAPATPSAGTDLAAYQRGTFAVMSVAFLGSYVYALGRLLDRVNNNDLYPVSLHYYGARSMIACLTAAVFRHTAYSLFITDSSMLMLVGFACGLAPDLMILAMARKGFQAIKIWESRADPDEQYRPTGFPLLMIDDLTKEKIDRLNELGIDSAQCLACQNPFLLWPRVPFDLGLITDWIAQGQLYAFVREAKLAKLRELCITDIFDFYANLKDASAAPTVCSAIGRDKQHAAVLVQQLDEDQSFRRLREVRDAMRRRPDGTVI